MKTTIRVINKPFDFIEAIKRVRNFAIDRQITGLDSLRGAKEFVVNKVEVEIDSQYVKEISDIVGSGNLKVAKQDDPIDEALVDFENAKNWFDGLDDVDKQHARVIIKFYANVINNNG